MAAPTIPHAYKIGLIDSNPADRIEHPQKETYVGSYYNVDELRRLFKAIKRDPLHYINVNPNWKRLMPGRHVKVKRKLSEKANSESFQHTGGKGTVL